MADVPGSPAAGSHDSGGEQSPHSNSNFREQDRFLPIANISRIMKKALPANGKIAKDAKDTVQECVSEFISFVTSEYAQNGFLQTLASFLLQIIAPVLHVLGVLAHALRQTLFLLKFYECNFMKLNFILCFWVVLRIRASDKCQKEKRKTINGDDLLWAMATLGFEDYIEPLKVYLSRYREGDSKGSARGDVSGKKDTVGSQIVPNAQYTHQGSYAQGMNYLNSHV
ncbi:hypothetical protein E3N88_03183 [Mikania micrantha]|uniref:Transcription factor CBF/NF-Y/archaeal histone domain-containing protein n=1 Tax=Mikania micrantha TaxID=192012 RepID=A0A5N6Q8E6_9ASTR|nr:hypothetical protein E3N88_03183 [Mikania micrantha]